MIYVSNETNDQVGLSTIQRAMKRSFDIFVASIGLIFLGWLMLLAALIATFDTGRGGFFRQVRIGRYGKPFKVLKLRTMREVPGIETSVTTKNDPRITSFGKFLRKTKLDELPQLVNVLVGHMSLVGPRPDVPGYADLLQGEERIILSVRPGITGPATLKYRNEEELLAGQADPEAYNRQVIFADKVQLNKDYVESYGFMKDLRYIFETVFG